MQVIVQVKTNRTAKGWAYAHITRFMNYSTNRIGYCFKFYQTQKFFKNYAELRDFVESNYEMIDYNYNEYHLPVDRKEFFK